MISMWNKKHVITTPSQFILYYTITACCGRDRMVVGFTTTYAISAYHH